MCWHGFLGGVPGFRPSGILAAESSNSLTWDSQNLRGWTAKDRVATPEALSKMKQMSSVLSEPQYTNRPIACTHKSVYASADVREPFMSFLRLLRDNRKLDTPCLLFKVIA